MKKSALAAALLVPALALAIWPERVDEPGWGLTLLTESRSCANSPPQISADGRRVFFISDCNLTGHNFDRSAEICNWDQGSLSQLTDTKLCVMTDLALAPDDQRLAFSSNCKLRDQDPGGGLEVVVREPAGDFLVLGPGHGYASRNPAWAPRGRQLVFESSADLTGENADHSQEIFLADLEASPPGFRQITKTLSPAGCRNPQLTMGAIVCRCNENFPGTQSPEDAARSHGIFEREPVGGNPDRNYELFSFDFSGGARQLTYTESCENGPPILSPRGQAIAVVSDCNLTREEKPAAGPKLYFLANQVSRPFPELNLSAFGLGWSGDGLRLGVSSSFGDRRGNPEGNTEVFVISLRAGASGLIPLEETRPLPVTDFPEGASIHPALNRDGAVMVFLSNASFGGHNHDRNFEVVLAVEPRSGDTAE